MENQTKIFLLDDNLFSLNFYRQELENMGFENISLFLNAALCLENLSRKPKVIFLNQEMNDVNALEILKKIKQNNASIYVIIISKQENIKIALDAIKYGAFDIIIIKDIDEITKIKNVIYSIKCIEFRFKE